VDVRIGVTHAPREINVEMDDGIDRQQLKADVATALADDAAVLWLTDKRGRLYRDRHRRQRPQDRLRRLTQR
jgi:hypothetical protein